MGTQLKEKQEELKKWIKKIGFSLNRFAQYYYNETESENEEETKQFQERFKKQLQRASTKVEIIESYLEFLFNLPEFEKIGYIKPTYVKNNTTSNTFNKRMKEISENITNMIENDNN